TAQRTGCAKPPRASWPKPAVRRTRLGPSLAIVAWRSWCATPRPRISAGLPRRPWRKREHSFANLLQGLRKKLEKPLKSRGKSDDHGLAWSVKGASASAAWGGCLFGHAGELLESALSRAGSTAPPARRRAAEQRNVGREDKHSGGRPAGCAPDSH